MKRGGDDASDECAVCFELFSQDVQSLRRRETFPCSSSHTFCASCSSKVDICPLCRQGRDGSTQSERIDEQDRNRAHHQPIIVHYLRSRSVRRRDLTTITIPMPLDPAHPILTSPRGSPTKKQNRRIPDSPRSCAFRE